MENLEKELSVRLKGAKRVAVLGVGSELRADDVAGILVAQALAKASSKKSSKLKVFFGDTAPENLTGEIKAYKPTHIIIIDTADMGEKAGSVLLLNGSEIGQGISFSTHKIPPRVLVDYFAESLKCAIMLIGIQPKSIDFGKKVSKPVSASAKSVSQAILSAI